MKIDSPNIPNRLLLDEVSSSDTPSSGQISVYGKTDGQIYTKRDDGTERGISTEYLIVFKILEIDEDLEVGDGLFYFTVPPEFNGKKIQRVYAFCYSASSSGNILIQIVRGRRSSATDVLDVGNLVDVLSTRIQIDQSEFSSTDSGAQPVVNTSNNELATRDVIIIDVDSAGTGTKGLEIVMVVD